MNIGVTFGGFNTNLQSNLRYGSKRRTPIFTPNEIADPIKRAQENERISKLIDKIGELYGDFKSPTMIQIFVHSRKCPACRQSFPLWKNITSELKRVLPTYYYFDVEFDFEKEILPNVRVSGEMLYVSFGASGIPFVVQNFEVVTRRLRNSPEYKSIRTAKEWFISYEGSIHPYGFLSKVFKVENPFVNSLVFKKV